VNGLMRELGLILVWAIAVVAVAFFVHQKGIGLIKVVANEFRQTLRMRPTKESVNGLAVIAILIIAAVIVIGEETSRWFHLVKDGVEAEVFETGKVIACLLVTSITLILSVKFITRK
jgi:hypothetical protein